jgi:hypothetical protein
MPYPDSEYPSILRGKDKRDSQRLLAAAPELLAALHQVLDVLILLCIDWQSITGLEDAVELATEAINKAEGRGE